MHAHMLSGWPRNMLRMRARGACHRIPWVCECPADTPTRCAREYQQMQGVLAWDLMHPVTFTL